MDLRGPLFLSTGILSLDWMINVADRALLQFMWFLEFSYFFSAMIILVMSSFWNETSAPPLQNQHGKKWAFIGVWSVRVRGPIGPGSGYSVMPQMIAEPFSC